MPWVAGNGLTALCYAAIPWLLYRLWAERSDLLPAWAMLSFGAFIALCGLGHVAKIVTLWVPLYHWAAWLDVLTGVVSIPAAVGLRVAIQSAHDVVPLDMHLRAVHVAARRAREVVADDDR